ncbi:MAG: hypothetical protein JXA78_08635 [Anaerolineales bacterium]|nr:hypothetical protein [Anaerolineales bacterium]
MIIGIHPDRVGNESYSDKWKEFLEARGVETRPLNLLALDAVEQAKHCDGVMWRWIHNPQDKQSAQRLLYLIEHYLHIPVFPNSRSAWHYDEKVTQYYLLRALEAPVPQTWLFWNQADALQWAQTAPYPLVFKLSSGAGSANVIRVENSKAAIDLIERVFNRGIFPYTMNEFKEKSFPRSLKAGKAVIRRVTDSLRYILRREYPSLHSVWWKPEHGYAYFQEFLPDNEFDIRITVIGNRAFGFRRLNRPGDFRASGSGRIEYSPSNIDPRCVEIAFQISERGGFQSMAYDFIYRQNHPVICEISYTFADWAVYNCPGHWERDGSWIEGKMWPEEAQIDDFVAQIEMLSSR